MHFSRLPGLILRDRACHVLCVRSLVERVDYKQADTENAADEEANRDQVNIDAPKTFALAQLNSCEVSFSDVFPECAHVAARLIIRHYQDDLTFVLARTRIGNRCIHAAIDIGRAADGCVIIVAHRRWIVEHSQANGIKRLYR